MIWEKIIELFNWVFNMGYNGISTTITKDTQDLIDNYHYVYNKKTNTINVIAYNYDPETDSISADVDLSFQLSMDDSDDVVIMDSEKTIEQLEQNIISLKQELKEDEQIIKNAEDNIAATKAILEEINENSSSIDHEDELQKNYDIIANMLNNEDILLNDLMNENKVAEAEENLLSNVEILNQLAREQAIKDWNDKLNMSTADMKKYIYDNCDDIDEWNIYKSMVMVDKIATWKDILIKQCHWTEHDINIRQAMNNNMLIGGSDKELKMAVYGFLMNEGYSDKFCKVTAMYYFQMFEGDIMLFRSLRHTFTDKDIQLELTADSDTNYRGGMQRIMERFGNEEISADKLVEQLQLLMIKRGFSNAFIDYTIRGFIRELLQDEDL